MLQAQEELQGKVSRLEEELQAAKSDDAADAEKIAALDEQLKMYNDKLGKEKETMKKVVKLRQEKDELEQELAKARDNIIYKARTVWLPRASVRLSILSSSPPCEESFLKSLTNPC